MLKKSHKLVCVYIKIAVIEKMCSNSTYDSNEAKSQEMHVQYSHI